MLKKNFAARKKYEKRIWFLNVLISRQIFSSLFFLNCSTIFKTLAPNNKKQIRNSVWNKNVSQVESSHKSLWNKFYLLELGSGNFSFFTISLNSTKLIIRCLSFLRPQSENFGQCFIFIWFDRLKQHRMTSNLVLTEMFTFTEKSAIFKEKIRFLKNSNLRTHLRIWTCYKFKKSVGRTFDTSRCCRK